MKLLLLLLFATFSKAENQTAKIIEANNRFTVDLYTQIVKTEKGNIILSPFSADSILALLQSGCEGPTAQELAKTLHLPNDKQKIQTGEKNLLGQLQKFENNDKVIFNTANALFIQQKFKIKDAFLKVATKDFYSTSQNVDFSEPQEAANTINKWVENKTHNTIKDLVTADSIQPSTVLILVNALRLKANWSIQFSVSETKKEDFHKTQKDVVKVDFIHQFRKHYRYYSCKSLKAEFLVLPFQGGEFSMVFVLPNDNVGLQQLENRASEVFDVSIPLESKYVNVALPKFKIEDRFDLDGLLENLGARKIFTPGEGDLTGISGQRGDLVVSQVVQKAFIDLNEGGVEAAAATFVGVSTTSINTEVPISFVANRPFLYYIKYHECILFVGRVVSPEY